MIRTFLDALLQSIEQSIMRNEKNKTIFALSRRAYHFAAILTILFLMVSVSPVSAQYDLFGYGRNATGGGNATPILVDTEQELLDALSGKKSDRVVIITANITVSTQFTAKGNNITLLALPGRCLISNGQSSEQSGILNMRGSNIIIRNVTFIGPGAYDCDGKDLLQFEDATNAWVDHCDFQDGCDGNFDIKSNSDNITVTWCRFRYLKPAKAGGSGGSADHRFTNLLGQSSSAKPADGTYNVSYAYNWWDNGCKERMVRCRNCEIHFFNCYWNSDVANYYVGPENATCYFEGCTFAGNANKADKIFKSYGGTNACKFVNSVGILPSNQGTVNTPSYPYFVESASDAVASITDANCGAGATLVVETDGSITTCGANLTKYTVTFNLNGKGTNFTQEVYENRTIAAPATPTTSGFVFDGWYTNQACTTAFDFSTPITANGTLYAKWVQAMTVTFNLNGKGTNFTQEVVSGGKASVPSNPTAAGYIFAGWYTDQACTTEYDFNTTITAVKTIYAKWEETNYCYEFTPATSGDALVVGSVIAGNANSGGTMTVSSLKEAGSISYDNKGLKFSSGSADIVTVTLDNYLQAGSIISLTLVSAGSTNERGLDILDANGKDVSELVWEVSASGEERTLSYEVTNDDNLVGTKVFQLQRHNSIYLKNITVGNCGGTSLPTYTITYKANGGTGDDIVAAETMTVANCTFTAPTGYEFSGWNTAADGSGTDYAVGRAINANVTLYAQWTIHSYTVHFDMQGHGSAISNQIVNYGAKVNEPNKPAVLDYTFGGWYKEAACTNAWNFETDVVTSEITLYAKWEELSNCADETVYDFSTQDEFTTAWDVVKASYDCAVQTSAYSEISPINNGMLGVGINGQNGSVTITTKAYYTNITNIVLKLASTDSSNPNVTVSVVNGSTVTDLFSVTPKTANIIRATSNKQWGTHAQELAGLSGKIRITFKSTSTNARYATIDDVKICGQETALSTYTVTFALNGGEGTAPTQAATTAGSTFTLASADGITKDGYTFAGWNDGTTTYAAGATYTMPANNITLTAQWTENVVTPDPTPGGGGGCEKGTVGIITTTGASGEGIRTMQTVDNITVTHQVVSTTSGAIAEYNKGDKPMYYASSTAIYSKGAYKWNKNTSSTDIETANNTVGYQVDVADGFTYSLSTLEFKIAASCAMMYKIAVCNSTETLYSSEEYTVTNYIKATAANYHQTIDLSGVDKVQNLSGTFVVKVYLKFDGTSKYLCFPEFTITGDVCSTSASASQTAITLSPQGGTGGTTEVTATYEQPMPEITVPTRPGYDFQGYFTANGGTGTKYYNADGTSAKNWDKEDATFTLIAYWTAKTTNVTLNANGGSGGDASVTATYGSAMPTITPATKVGYTLTGYFDAASGGTKYYNADGTSAKNWDKTSATTLYAQWECTAPTNVVISGEYIRFPGETLTLTVSGENITGDATYTWKKGDQVLAGQTTATLTINNATITDAGNYTCTVSNGTGCEATANYTVKMYSLRGLIDWSTDCAFTKVNATTATYSMELAGSSFYEFKIFDGNVYYGNEGDNPTMTSSNCTNWPMKENIGNNVRLQTTASGTYTFTLDYTDASNLKISVTYPQKKMVYLNPGEWNCAKYAVYSWDGEGNSTVLMTKIDDCAGRNIYQAEIDASHSNVIFIGGTATYNVANTWNNVSHKTIDLTYPSDEKVLFDLTQPNTTHLFLTPNANWKVDGARFAAYFFGNGDAWSSLSYNDKENIYYCKKISGYPSVIFCRMNPNNATNGWGSKWNQSSDLTIPTNGNNHYTVAEGAWDKGSGTWSTVKGEWTSFTPNYSVTFDANGHGTAPEAQCVAKNGKATQPTPAPTTTGYTFGGWYKEAGCTNAYDFNTEVTSNITLYAKWTVNTYQITYKEEDRTTTIEGLEPTTYTYGVGVAELPTPSEKIGYTFDSWYSEYCIFEDEEGVNNPGHGWVDDCKRTSIATTDYGNVTFLAKYIPNTYTITLNTNGGTINAGEINSYTFGVGTTLPTDVTKENYTFLGWFDNEGLTGTAVTTIPTNATGDKTYWAKWEENTPVTPEPEDGTCWNISDAAFNNLGAIKTTQTVNGLNIVATSKENIVVDTNKKTIEGYDFTHRLKLSGTGKQDSRHLKFAVTGACTIDVYLMSGNSTDVRTLNVAIGSFGSNVTALTAGTTIAKQTYEYTGSATDIYMYSASSGINIYQICVTYPTTPTPDPGTQYTVTHTLSNVTATAGATGAEAATEGAAYAATFEAATGFVLPNTINVTIGGATQAAGTGYTWNPETGVLNIPADKVKGDIVITIAGQVKAPELICEELFYAKADSKSTFATTVGTIIDSNLGDGYELSDVDGFEFSVKPNDSNPLVISPKDGETFQAGDKITVWVYNSGEKTMGFKLESSALITAKVPAKTLYAVEATLVAGDITTSDGNTTIVIGRNSSDARWVAVQVERCVEKSCTAPVNQLTISTLASVQVSQTAAISVTGGNEGPIAFTVTPATGAVTGNDGAYSFSATEVGEYVIKATQADFNGVCGGNATCVISVTAIGSLTAPSITATDLNGNTADEFTFCETDNDDALKVVASNTEEGVTYTYQWYVKETDSNVFTAISNATEAIYPPTMDGTYYCEVTAKKPGYASASANSKEWTINITQSTAIISQPTSVALEAGQATLEVEAEGENLQYQWYSCEDDDRTNPQAIAGATHASYTTTQTGYYYVVLRSDCGVDRTSDVVEVTKEVEYCFNMTDLIKANKTTINSQSELTSTHATITGGTVLYDRVAGETMELNENGLKFNSNGDYLKVTLKESALTNGTVIEFTYYVGSTGRGIKILKSDKTTEICSNA